MIKEELLERVGAWLNLSDPEKRTPANRKELNILYQAVTGKAADCSYCINWLIKMAAKLREFEARPESFTVKPTQTQIMATKSTKYKPAKGKENVVVVLNHPNGTSERINVSEMSDAQAERIAKSPQFKHNVEKVEAKADAPKTATAKPAPKAAPAKADTAEATKKEGTDKA